MTSADATPSPARGRAPGFRPDIEGLRAVAIGLVLIYHAGVDELPGGFVGVDVFFVISGFLITGLLVREIERSGRVALREFYARRAKRLLPAAGLVLAATALLTWFTAPVTQWRTFGLDIVAASTYVVNWVLADRSVDYLAEDVDVSPVQHFWSLAVEEQFYIVWPLLLVLVGVWLRRRGTVHLRRVLTVAISLVIVPSFVWSVVMTANAPQQAFFVTTTRLWELGIGALVAIGGPLWTRVPNRWAAVIGWGGLTGVLASGLLLSSAVAWPGYAALAPALGTAAVIVAGFRSGRAGPAVILSWRPAVWLGGLSYSLYLWHWPLWVAATNRWGELGATRGLLVMLVSLFPAYLSLRLLENPIRFSRRVASSARTALSIGAGFSLVGVTAGLTVMLLVPVGVPVERDQQAGGASAIVSSQPTPEEGSDSDPEGSRAASPGTLEGLALEKWWKPSAVRAAEDVPELYDEGCQVDQDGIEAVRCEFGDPDGDVTVAVAGDSKIAQWMSALDEIGRDRGWHIVSFTKSSCALSDAMQVNDGAAYEACAEWNERVREVLLAEAPDVVLVSSRLDEALEDPSDAESLSREAAVDGLAEAWTFLLEHGLPVVVLLDNPNPVENVYECVARNPKNLDRCTFDREKGLDSGGYRVQVEAAERAPGVDTVDMTDLVCPSETCVPVIGNVLVYRQTSHITDTYARSLTPFLAERLAPVIEDASA